MVPLLRELTGRGHEVVVASASSFAGAIASAGFRPHAVGLDFRVGEEARLVPDLAAARERRDDAFPYTRRVLVETLGAAAVADVLALASSWRPDVVLRDPVEFASLAVAEALGLPHATGRENRFLSSAAWAAELGDSLQHLGQRAGIDDLGVHRLYRYLGLAPVSPRFALVRTGRPPAREFGTHVHPTTRFTRPESPDAHAGPGRASGGGSPRVLASFGTVFVTPDLVDALLGAAERNDWQVLVTEVAPDRSVPRNVRFIGYTPLSQVLPSCDAVLTLGGLGTVMAALTHGLPVVVAPVNADQPVNAARCEALGVGVRVSPSTTAAVLADAVNAVLTNPSFAARARAERAEMEKLPGASAAATLVETVARTRRPVPGAASDLVTGERDAC